MPKSTPIVPTEGTIKIQASSSLLDDINSMLASLPAPFRKRSSGSGLSVNSDTTASLLSTITVKNIKKSKRIGVGGFGDVMLLNHPSIGKVALKRLRLSISLESADDQKRRALREGAVWQNLLHPNILPCLGVLEAVGNLFIVSPYVPKGSLDRYLKSHPRTNRDRLVTSIADAVAYLHEKGIVHGDIKAANVLVSNDLQPLLCDFGLAKSASEDTSIGLEGHGTIRWQSPEVLLSGGGKTFASDVWAFGMLIYEILSGQIPFYDTTSDFSVIRIITETDTRPPQVPQVSSAGEPYQALWDLASMSWVKEPSERCNMRDAYCSIRRAGGYIELPKSVAQTKLAWSHLSPSGDLLVTAHEKESLTQVYIWKVGSVEQPRSLKCNVFESRAVFGPTDRHMIVALQGSRTVLQVWDLDTLDVSKSFDVLDGWMMCMAVSHDGQTLAVASRTGKILSVALFAINTSTSVQIRHSRDIRRIYPVPEFCQLAFSQDGRYLTVVTHICAEMWDVRSRKVARVRSVPINHDAARRDIWELPTVWKDGSLVAVLTRLRYPVRRTKSDPGKTYELRIWDVDKETVKWQWGWESTDPRSLAFSSDTTVAIGSYHDALTLMDMSSLKKRAFIARRGHAAKTMCRLEFSSNGKKLVGTEESFYKTLRILDVDRDFE